MPLARLRTIHSIHGIRRLGASMCAATLLIFGACGVAAASDTGAQAFFAKGNIASPDRVTLTAPVGGQLQSFTWLPGDAAEAGVVAFALTPTQVFAADDGVIRGLHAIQDDQAEQVIAEYGALCSIDRDDVRQVRVSKTSAYNKAENRDVRVGDVLRVQQGSGDKEVTGVGTVVQAAQDSFVLEMPQGKFDLEETVRVYQGTGTDYKSKDQAGKGKVARPLAIPVLGEGRVAAVLVTEGQRVTRGEPIFTLDAASAHHPEPPDSEVVFPRQGAVVEVLVRPGQFVGQGQALMTLLPTDALEASLDVDELDIARVALGQHVRVTVDAYPGRMLTATVREILPQGSMVLDTTKFQVKVQLDETDGLMLGMHVTGYWD